MGTDIRHKLAELLTLKAPLAQKVAEVRLPALPRQIAGAVERMGLRDVAPFPVAPEPSLDEPAPIRDERLWHRRLRLSFLAMVLLPALAGVLYFGFIASNQYVSELQFAVRGTTEKIPGASVLGMGALVSLASLNSNQEAYAVADFIRSRAMVDSLASTVDLREVFGRPEIDAWARLSRDASEEDLVRMWNHMVHVEVETVSGIVTVAVKAFTPAEATSLGTSIRQLSEGVINRIQARMRQDMVSRAEAEVARARSRLGEIQGRLRAFRNTSAVVEPLESAQGVLDTVTKLRGDLVALDVQLDSLRRTAGPNAPQVKPLESRRQGLKEQIAALEGGLTGKGETAPATSQTLVGYDRLQIERTLAEQQVVLAERFLEHARSQIDRQHIYLDLIDGPTLAQEAQFPQRGHMIFLIAFAALVIWGVAALLSAGVRDHAA